MKDETPLPTHALDLKIYRDSLKVSKLGGRTVLFDPIRKQHVAATPEEMVRQLAICWLIEHYQLGRGRMIVEKQIVTGVRERRFDLAVLDRDLKPWMLLECKAPGILLNDSVWLQAALYNRTIGAPYIWITNGHEHRVGHWDIEEARFDEIRFFPSGS